jgi:hypothetical protein
MRIMGFCSVILKEISYVRCASCAVVESALPFSQGMYSIQSLALSNMHSISRLPITKKKESEKGLISLDNKEGKRENSEETEKNKENDPPRPINQISGSTFYLNVGLKAYTKKSCFSRDCI